MAIALGGCYSGVEDFDANAAGGLGGEGGGDDEGQVDELCGKPQAGPTSLRRLTRTQYEHTVRDLLGFVPTEAEGFAPDERVGAFKSNAAAPVGGLQVEQYMDAAESIATSAASDLLSLLPCDPATGEDACAEQWLRELAPRAYRRPLSEGDLNRIIEVYSTAKAGADFETGIRVALQGILQSPYVLYHVEMGDLLAEAGEGEAVPLSGHELASRLSYFLWDTMPDDALFAAASAGELETDEGLELQIERMLEDPRAETAIANFHLQWLGVDELELLEKSPAVHPEFDPALARAMREDTASFSNWIIAQGDGRLETLLTGAFTFTEDPALLELYGVERPAGHQPGDPIALPAVERAGVLTQPGVLAAHSHADQSSPVYRGKLVRENILCQPLPAPPPDVDNVPPEIEPGATTRERLEQHKEDPTCAACHELIDGVGFGFEHYDATGAYRVEDNGLPVDASGEMVGTEQINGEFDGAIELVTRLPEAAEVRECMARQWFRYSLGRMDTAEDSCTMERLSEAFADSDYDIRVLIHEIVLSDAFRHRRPSDEASAPAAGEED